MSRLKHDYSVSAPVVDAFGGLKALEAVRDQVKGLDLPPCPFCGGEAVFVLGTMYTTPSVTVECSHCHGRTASVGPSYDYFTGTQTSIHDAVNDTARRWSRREHGAA
ncbi:hypothetical protein CE91St43_21640 [Oscillospiraceae bacterium]|nr:hypothetical protein CE91St43_21640 [Oscillospiraceae bacterium]